MKSFANIVITGKIITEPKVLVEYGLETIYEATVSYKRTSGKEDKFIINYSSGLSEMMNTDVVGKICNIRGELRTTKYENITKIYIKVREVEFLDVEPEVYENNVRIQGILVREPRRRKSFADNETDIADLTIKVERGQSKASYIPVIAWNNNARLTSKLNIDDVVNVNGRLQGHITSHGYLMTEVTTTVFDNIEE